MMLNIDDFYKKNQDDFHTYLQQTTGSTSARCTSIYEEVLVYTKHYRDIFENINLREIKPSDHNIIRNRLRYFALRLDIADQKFQRLSVQEQHRFCARLKERFSQHAAITQYEEIVRRARKELIQLVHKEPECTDESILQWIQQYVDNELLIYSFTEMWEKLKPWLERLAKSKTKTPEEAEDIFQQTYYNALRYIRKHHTTPEEEKCKAWLATIMRNTLMDDVRNQGNSLHTEPITDEQIELILDEEDIEKRVIDRQERKTLEQIIRTLSREDDTVLMLYILQDRSLNEIATILNEKLETIRGRFKRARPRFLAKLPAKSLREYLKYSPRAQFKLQQSLQSFIPVKASKDFNIADINIESPLQYEIIVRSILSLHLEGFDSREIAEMFSLEKKDNATFEKHVANIQTCLEENLLRLFSSLYSRDPISNVNASRSDVGNGSSTEDSHQNKPCTPSASTAISK